MTDQKINIAIAECCGWAWKDYVEGTEAHWEKDNGHTWSEELPNYTTDLNAMHEAEKSVLWPCGNYWEEYEEELAGVISPNEGAHIFTLILATARERAEAFLKVVGKWKG